ncbi:MAG: DNRLRE domain-containing protein [bacterium]
MIEIEDEDTNLRFFFPEDYAWAEADSANDFSERIKIRRYMYTDRGKDYMLVGAPWDWVNAAPKGNLIIDPTTTITSSDDVRLQDTNNYGSGATLAVGKPAGFTKRRTIIKFNITGVPTNATVLNAQFKLWYYSNNGTPANNRWVQAHQLLVNWDELQATRDNRLTATPWAAQYGALDGTDANAAYESTLLFSQNEPVLQWKTWDLSALMQKWVKVSGSGSAPNYGVMLWATDEDTDGHTMQFNSSEAASNQPYLEIIWSNTPKTVYFLKDHLGSVRATVLDSATAPVIGYEDYDPWGYPLVGRTKAIPNAYLQGASKNRFTGIEYDDDYGINWSYFPVRSYDSQSARWLSVDPLDGARPWESPYLYVGRNPIVRTDSEGLYWVDTNRDGIADTWVVEHPIVAEAEQPQNEEAIIRPRYGRLFGLGFLAAGEVSNLNNFLRVRTGLDPFSGQQLSSSEPVFSGISAALTIFPARFVGLVKNLPLKQLTGNQLYNAIIRTGWKATDHFIKSLKDVRIAKWRGVAWKVTLLNHHHYLGSAEKPI